MQSKIEVKMIDQGYSDTAVLDRPLDKTDESSSEGYDYPLFTDDNYDKKKSLDIEKTDDIEKKAEDKEREKPSEQIKDTKEELKVEIELLGEQFYLMKKDGEIHLKHKAWSLAGFGETNAGAFEDLKRQGKILLSVYSDMDRDDLAEDAKNMVDFLKITFGDG